MAAISMTELLALEFLQAIEQGDITLVRLGKGTKFYDDVAFFYGNVTYLASNGWILTVFFDCGEWDYIDSLMTDTGEIMSYEDWTDLFNRYRPEVAIRRDVYGEPVELYEIKEEQEHV